MYIYFCLFGILVLVLDEVMFASRNMSALSSRMEKIDIECLAYGAL